MLSKKGQGGLSMDSTGFILLAVIGTIVILGVMVIVFNQDEVFENWACKSSIYFSDQTGGEGDFVPFIDINPILCKTHYTKLKNQEDLADKMVTTWRVFGEGELDPSGTNWFLWNENKCFELYKGEVFDDLVGVTKEGFTEYLKLTEELKSKNTYWNFLNKGNDKSRVVIGFDVLSEGDFVGVYYFENVKAQGLLFGIPGIILNQYLNLVNQDAIAVSKYDGNNGGLKCSKIE